MINLEILRRYLVPIIYFQNLETSFSYDGMGQLYNSSKSINYSNQVSQITENYDYAGNSLLSKLGTTVVVDNRYFNKEQTLSVNEDIYNFDALGRMRQIDSSTNLEWAINNRLNSITKSDGSQVNYLYFADGSRFLRKHSKKRKVLFK